MVTMEMLVLQPSVSNSVSVSLGLIQESSPYIIVTFNLDGSPGNLLIKGFLAQAKLSLRLLRNVLIM